MNYQSVDRRAVHRLLLRTTFGVWLLCSLGFAADLSAAPAEELKPAIELGAPFADNAILQREMKVPVWGWSKAGTKVTVGFAGQKKSATAGEDGKWMVKLDELKANAEPQEMVIQESGKTVTLKNILVGEVWMASGQSNMQWNASKCDVGRVLMKGIEERVAAGTEKPPVIREGLVTNYFAALHPIEHAEAKWSPAGGDSSAIAYAFAYKLHQELGVPIGILNCSFSQTAIQAWVPRCGFAEGEDEYTKAIYQKILETDPTSAEHKAAWDKFYGEIESTIKENEELVKKGEAAKQIPTKTPGNLSGNRDASWLFNARLNPMIPYAIRGGIWNQGYANMGEGLPYYNNLHSMIRGWRKLWNRPELPVYFHQFYCPGQKGEWNNSPSIGSTAEMRLGTWLARDIPNSGMASQIDITGAIHYANKTLPGQRLALHALKNQYGKSVIADGPMFKSYKVEGNQLIVELDHAEGGLVVAETGTDSKSGIANPTVIPNGEAQVALFYLADEKRVWHPASMKIDGNQVVVTSPKVKSPRGVSYGTGGIGFQPNLYNRALLPTTPFIYFDNKMVTKEDWPHDPIQIAGIVPDPNAGGKVYEYRKMPLLSTQFRDNAVLQAGKPVTIWGSAVHDWGYEAEGEAVIKFSFAGVEKTIPVTAGMKKWQVILPAMKASAKPNTLKVTFTIDGEIIHERVAENVVIGDVWYVATPDFNFGVKGNPESKSLVRAMKRKAKGGTANRARPYSVCVSTTPKNRFACIWEDADGSIQALGQSLAAESGNPVGLIVMQGQASIKVDGKTKGVPLELKHWMPTDSLKEAPSLMGDYKQLAAIKPGNDYYNANAHRYIADWKKLWGEYIPQMISSKSVPDGVPWGTYPSVASAVTTDASQAYFVMTHSFGPASLKGIIFLSSANMVEGDKAANYGSELSALANGWKKHFGGDDTAFFYTIPAKSLAPKVTAPGSIKGESTGVEISDWSDAKEIQKFIEKIAKETSS